MKEAGSDDKTSLVIFISRAATKLPEELFGRLVDSLRSKLLADPETQDLERYLISKQELSQYHSTIVHTVTNTEGKEMGVARRNNLQVNNGERRPIAIEAFNILQQALIDDPNPHVMPVIHTGQAEAVIIVPFIENLYELNNTDDIFEALIILEDALDGGAYLARHNLVLEDIKLDNIGFIKDEKGTRGVLHDLDGLVTAEVAMGARLATPKYIPPEIRRAVIEKKKIMATEAEMVYQFGVILRLVVKASIANLEWFFERASSGGIISQSFQFVNINEKFNKLIRAMTADSEKNRPTLAEALELLTEANNYLMLRTFPDQGVVEYPEDTEATPTEEKKFG